MSIKCKEINKMKYVIVKYAQDSVWGHYFLDDPKQGVHLSHSAFDTPTGKDCNVKLSYESYEQEQALRDLENINAANPVGSYALCPLIE